MYIHMYRDINIWNEKMNYFLFWVWTSSCCRMGRFDAMMAPYSTYKWYKNAWEIRCLKLHKGVKQRLICFFQYSTLAITSETDGSKSTYYSDVILSAMASQITGVSIVCPYVCSGSDQRKRQSSASLAFVRGSTGDRWIPLTKGQ